MSEKPDVSQFVNVQMMHVECVISSNLLPDGNWIQSVAHAWIHGGRKYSWGITEDSESNSLPQVVGAGGADRLLLVPPKTLSNMVRDNVPFEGVIYYDTTGRPDDDGDPYEIMINPSNVLIYHKHDVVPFYVDPQTGAPWPGNKE